MAFVHRLIWDSWNIAHIARHDVTPEEVEEVCHSDPLVQESYAGRYLITGPAHSGRMLAIVLDPEPEPGHYYVVTARPADRKERRMYSKQKGVTG